MKHANQHLLNKHYKIRQLPKELAWSEYVKDPNIKLKRNKRPTQASIRSVLYTSVDN